MVMTLKEKNKKISFLKRIRNGKFGKVVSEHKVGRDPRFNVKRPEGDVVLKATPSGVFTEGGVKLEILPKGLNV